MPSATMEQIIEAYNEAKSESERRQRKWQGKVLFASGMKQTNV